MEKRVEIDLGRPNSEPQWRFFLSRAKYTCYGGAREGKELGGGAEGSGWGLAVSGNPDSSGAPGV